MFKVKEEENYFLSDYPNYEEEIMLKCRNQIRIRKYRRCSEMSRLNSKIMVFKNQNYHYLSLDCDKGLSKVNPIIIDFLNQYNIVYFTTIGTLSENKPKDSASLCIKYKNYNKEALTKLNKLFKVVGRLPNGEMSCDPLAIGYMMKSIFSNYMESRYYNRENGNVFDLEELTEIAFCHFNRNCDEVKHLAYKYYSEAYYLKYKKLIINDFDEICVNKLGHYYHNMKKHNYSDWLFDSKKTDEEFHLIMKKYEVLPLEKKVKTVSKRTLIRDYILVEWCKYEGYAEILKSNADLLWTKFKISKNMIHSVAKNYGIQLFNTSNKYFEFVSLIEAEHLTAIKNKLSYSRTKKRYRYKPTKKHKEHKNKGKFTMYIMEKNGKIKEVKSTNKAIYIKRGWLVVNQIKA